MSWVKRRDANNSAAAAQQVPQVPLYDPNQHSTQETNQWSNPQMHDNWYNQQQFQPVQNQQNYWPQQQQQQQQQYNSSNYNQIYGQQQQQQPQQQFPNQYSTTTTGNYQNTEFYGNLQYNNEQFNQNVRYEQQQQQQSTDGDVWNQAWGDEDNSNVQQVERQTSAPVQDSAPGLDEAFANDSSWNWGSSLDDTQRLRSLPPSGKDESTTTTTTTRGSKLGTPQWSTESQVSQESSTTTSEPSDKSNKNVGVGVEEAGLTIGEENRQVVMTGGGRGSYRGRVLGGGGGGGGGGGIRSDQVNLETVPDNVERPDLVPDQFSKPVKMPATPSFPENNELPMNDRNQYLETGQLSESTDFDVVGGGAPRPPPGLHRMIPAGQTEKDTEPPPGLKRMIPGQLEQKEDNRGASQKDSYSGGGGGGPPEGLHRMIPGESSSPESNLLRQSRRSEEELQEEELEEEEDESGDELEMIQQQQQPPPPRSATIGADTPPIVPPQQQIQTNNDLTGGKERRDSIEGQNRDLSDTLSKLSLGAEQQQQGGGGSESGAPHRGDRSTPSSSRRRESSDSGDGHHKDRVGRPPRAPPSNPDSKRRSDKYSPDSSYNRGYNRGRYRRGGRYEEDTDYYSDKERGGGRYQSDDRDYDSRKYSSLRKEKDKQQRNRRDYRRPGGGDYDRGYEDDYDNYEDNRGSRPSSRSDSMHDSYRERHNNEKERNNRERKQHDRDRDRDKERYRRRRGGDIYPNYQQGYSTYDPYNPYYQQYQYYENLRRNNPHAYAEWYRKYYQQSGVVVGGAQTASSYGGGGGGEDRGSVHSGRSSANEELIKDSYSNRPFDSSSLDHHHQSEETNDDVIQQQQQRLTPAKFSMAHFKASIGSGKLTKLLPSDFMGPEGFNSSKMAAGLIEITNLGSALANDDVYKELVTFPGPLVKGVTHKKTIIEYCENKIRTACYNQNIIDPDSYVLMWELLILLIRQNGMVIGTDIAELLLKNRKEYQPQQRPPSAMSNISSLNGDVSNHLTAISETNISENTSGNLKEEEITSKFREFLLYGSGQEALEWAMKHNLWGHALFLASKLDKRTYANVMMRFANGLTLNDPLQTLYQLLSGKIPAAVTCVADEKWGDWRPHLAMILSNSTQRPELNRSAITTLGDTLRHRGALYAAHFCYLMAECEFSSHEDPNGNVVLLGVDHHRTSNLSFITEEAVHMTEIYEYACALNDPEFVIPHFQAYKFVLATRLADRGLLEKALAYLEKIAGCLSAHPSLVATNPALVENVYRLGDRLKFYDPIGDVEDESQFGTGIETSRPDHSWLKDLKNLRENLQAGVLQQQQQIVPEPLSEQSPNMYEFAQPQDAWQSAAGQYEQQAQVWQQQDQVPLLDYQQPQQQQQQNDFSLLGYGEQQQPVQQQQWGEQFNQFNAENRVVAAEQQQQQQSFYTPPNAQIEEYEQPLPVATPRITMPNQRQDELDGKKKMAEEAESKSSAIQRGKKETVAESKDGAGSSSSSTGWLGGIFSKLSLKPKNQMKLPDDKNPKIVWDETKKRWINVDEDPSDPSTAFRPPPKVAAPITTGGGGNIFEPPKIEQTAPANNPEMNPLRPAAQNSNMFKMQKGRNLKNSYVDVFKPNNKSTSGPTSLPTLDFGGPQITGAPQQQQPMVNMFVPQPLSLQDPNAPVDFLTPGGAPRLDTQLSRWSSASSLSKEVQYYMKPPQTHHQQHSLTSYSLRTSTTSIRKNTISQQ